MALVVNDRVKETSTTTGTGTFSLAGAVSGFETFVAGIGNTNTTYYTIVNTDGAFEVGIGTVTDAATDTLSRDTILSSSNSDSAVDFAAGTKQVFCTLPASKAVILDSSGNIVANNGSNLTNLNASNLASGTVPDARFPATLPAADGSNLTALNATQLTSGTVPDARFPATLPAADGSNLTALNASNVASGTLSSDRLPTVPTTKGGTGLTTIGTANQVLAVNSGGTALEYQTPTTGDITGVTAGSGLTGGGTSGDVTLNVGAGNLIDVQADQIDVDLSELTTSTSDADGDFFVVVDSANAQKKLTKANINNSGFNNDAGFTTNTGTVTSVSGGNGLTGTVTTSGSLAVGAGTGIDVAADSISIDLSELTTSTSDADGDFFAVVDAANAQKKLTKGNINISGFNNDSGFTTNTGTVTSVSGGNGLTGTVTTSGSLAVGAGTLIDVTADAVSVDLSELSTSTSDADGDFFVVVDSANAQKKLTKGNINISGFNNDAGYTSNTGDITGVTAGSGLTGGGSSGSVTLNIGAGTGIDVAADSIAVDVSDFMSNGSNNRIVTATGTDAMNAETNLTFDGTTLDVSGVLKADKGYVPEATLTDGATINWNMSTQSVCKVTLGGNRTMAAPTNGSTGQFASITVIQDGTGSRTLTWNAVYEFASDTAPTLSTTANKADLFVFRYNGTKWLEVGRNLLLTVS